jgi:hypothetical protein
METKTENETVNAELEALREENRVLKAQGRLGRGLSKEVEDLAIEKVAAGLSKEQAIEVAKSQVENDKRVAKEEAEAAKKKEKE